MRELVRRMTLVVAVVGIGFGGAALLSPSPAITGDEQKHIDEERNCLTGCDPASQICCAPEGGN